jgi:alpha-beta hydrolase superfamily lysophospholipase
MGDIMIYRWSVVQKMEKLILKDSLNNNIHIYIYRPKVDVKAVVQIIHGASEHFARYGIFADYLTKNGYAVVGCDILGHGLSSPTSDYVHFADRNPGDAAFESVVLVKDYINQTFPEIPLYLLGHSMGSFLAFASLLSFPKDYQKAVLTGMTIVPLPLVGVATMIGKVINFFKGPKYVSKLMQNLLIDSSHVKMRKRGIISGINEEWLTKDVAIQQYYHDSEICGQPFTVSANLALLGWLKLINSKKNQRQLPKSTKILFASGMDDPLGGYGDGIKKLHSYLLKSGFTNVFLKLYETDRHEILNEIDRDVVFADILDFFEN